MRLVEFTAAKGGAVWVNPDLVIYVGAAETASASGSSMYGGNNVRNATRLFFSQGPGLDVKENVADVVARLTEGAAAQGS